MKLISNNAVVVNGKFRGQLITGVQRFANEFMKMSVYKEEIPSPWFNSPLKKILWEQVILPFKTRGKLLLNLCNTSPLFKRNKVVVLFDVGFLDGLNSYSFLFSLYYRYVIKYAAKNSLRIATSSQYSKMRISELIRYPEEKIDVVYCGVNHKHFYPRNPLDADFLNKFNLPEKYFLFVGSLDPRKNIKTAINAINHLSQDYPELKLAVCGVGSKNFSEIGFDDDDLRNVHFLGYLEDEFLPNLYSNALAFIFPSLYEGFGLPVLEAMACGTPVLSSNRTSLPEVIGDAGVLFEPEDHCLLSDSMRNIYIDSKYRDSLINKGILQASKFTWDNTSYLLNDCVRKAYESNN